MLLWRWRQYVQSKQPDTCPNNTASRPTTPQPHVTALRPTAVSTAQTRDTSQDWQISDVLKPQNLTPGSKVLPEKLTGSNLLKKFPAFYGTWRFTTAFTRARHLSSSWKKDRFSLFPHYTSLKSILILSSHLRIGLPSGLLPSGFPTKTLHALFLPP